mmetsp:Transcript_40305/g.124518  ORF Transcript_40305/g.124518 Transcript_40305/m.124518 type:complete len:226 (-) Transcript_40305:1735-2412(-)
MGPRNGFLVQHTRHEWVPPPLHVVHVGKRGEVGAFSHDRLLQFVPRRAGEGQLAEEEEEEDDPGAPHVGCWCWHEALRELGSSEGGGARLGSLAPEAAALLDAELLAGRPGTSRAVGRGPQRDRNRAATEHRRQGVVERHTSRRPRHVHGGAHGKGLVHESGHGTEFVVAGVLVRRSPFGGEGRIAAPDGCRVGKRSAVTQAARFFFDERNCAVVAHHLSDSCGR